MAIWSNRACAPSRNSRSEDWAVLLSTLGGTAGTLVAVTSGYALLKDWPAIFPSTMLAGGLAIAALVGALAGAYPASRAARLSPRRH
ncbi:MAG TPA: hypothetical protein VM677_21895 [Actinokineospora sp.]|jgi:putative ABC transport system permease protein|nr:hypothetical protein [Actinokineospora sp.]